MIWLGLWPGIDRAYLRVVGLFPRDVAEIQSDVAELLQKMIGKLSLSNPGRVALTLLWNLERDLLRRRVDAAAEARRAEELGEEHTPQTAPPAERGAAELAARLAQLIGAERAELLARVLFLGEERAEAGAALGLSEEAAKKRIQRALAELAEKLKP